MRADKTKYLLMILLLYFGCSLFAAESLIERSPFRTIIRKPQSAELAPERVVDPSLSEKLAFVGTYQFDGRRRFSLQYLEENKKFLWHEISDRVLEYSLVEYDSEVKMLILSKDGKLHPLELQNSASKKGNHAVRAPLMRPPQQSKRPPRRIPTRVEFPSVLERKA